MSWMAVVGPCVTCGRLFSFSPYRVPSVLMNGTREPLCRTCVERANPERVKRGLAPIAILPGAYEAEEVGA